MKTTKPRGRPLSSEAASEMAKARWEGVSRAKRKRLMAAAGKLGGRPRERKRCFCGANALSRALARGFDCCRKAGIILPRTGHEPA